MMHGFGFNGFGGMGGFGLLGGLLSLVVTLGVIAGLVLLVVWAVRRFAHNSQANQELNHSVQAEQSPREILMQRYARGEVDREQYQQMLADLS